MGFIGLCTWVIMKSFSEWEDLHKIFFTEQLPFRQWGGVQEVSEKQGIQDKMTDMQ